MLADRDLNNKQRNCHTVPFLFLKETKSYCMLFIRKQNSNQCLKKQKKKVWMHLKLQALVSLSVSEVS